MEVQRRMLTAPKWINPCGMTGESTNVQDNATGSILSDAELITQINAQAGVAFIKADRFKEDYVSHSLNSNRSVEIALFYVSINQF